MSSVPAPVVTLLSSLVEERTGLHYSDRNREPFLQLLIERAHANGFESLLDYYYALRYDDPEGGRCADLADALVVGETYFFREPSGLQRVVERVAERAAAKRRSRIWSAGCATGEEPLSLACLLAEADLLGWVEIVATDLSPRHLDRASRGEHSRRSLRNHPEGRPPWIVAGPDRAVVDPVLRASISWRRVNLVERRDVAWMGRFDAILCRNVMIYFSDRTVARLTGALAEALEPDGILVIGASESLLRFGTVLECTERSGCFLYSRQRDR